MALPWEKTARCICPAGGFEPHAIRAMFFQVQLVRHLESQVREVKRREQLLEQDLQQALNQALKYRRLVMMESHMGMMLERITEI